MKKKKITRIFALLCTASLLTACASETSAPENNTAAVTNSESDAAKNSDSVSPQIDSTESESSVSKSPKPLDTTEETVPSESPAASDTEITEPNSNLSLEASSEMEKLATNLPTAETYDYVALGNSVTANVTDDLWHGSWGMAATSPEKDYVHIVGTWLTGQTSQPVNVQAITIEEWEVAMDRNSFYVSSPDTAPTSSAESSGSSADVSSKASTDLSELSMMEQIDAYVNENTDLITIQTGENITDNKADLTGDYSRLVSYLKEKAPNAKIYMLAELLWPSGDIEAAKQAVCGQNGIIWVDMSEYLSGYDTLYRSALGTVYIGDDGNTYSIANEVVAAHPSDAGMANIAQQIINQISVP